MAYTTIDDPSVYFQANAYTGNGSTQDITNGGNSDLQPDWIWTKDRDDTSVHYLVDSSRGTNKLLRSSDNNGESTSTSYFTAFNSDGFSLGTNNANNQSGSGNIAWQWKANGGTVANDTNGDITTSVQASQTAGFSIATYTGNGGSGQTLGHGLGAEADLIIFKDRESASAWRTYVRLLGASKFLDLNTTNAANTSSNVFPSASSTTIGVEQNDVMNKNNSDFVMYSFRSIQGYSKIGSYTGNANANGPFVYTGFAPAWVMVKNTASAIGWVIQDNARSSTNPRNKRLFANITDAEATDTDFDFLSNGFKLRNSGNTPNKSGEVYIYMAFAESPFVSSEGVPTTAR